MPRGRPKGIKRFRRDFTLSSITLNMLDELNRDYKNRSRVVDNAIKHFYKMRRRKIDF